MNYSEDTVYYGVLNVMAICIWNTYTFNRSMALGISTNTQILVSRRQRTDKTIIPFIIFRLSSIDEICRDRFVKKEFHFLSSFHQVFVTRLHILFVCKGLERPSINKCSTKTELNLSFRCTYIVLLPRLRKSCSSQNTYCFKNNSLLLHLGLLISWFQFSWNVKDEKRRIKAYSSI